MFLLQTIVKRVMDILLDKYAVASQLQQEQQNRDNLQASILHFFCVLFKDGDLKSTLSGYIANVFNITISMIESSEWTIRLVHFVFLCYARMFAHLMVSILFFAFIVIFSLLDSHRVMFILSNKFQLYCTMD